MRKLLLAALILAPYVPSAVAAQETRDPCEIANLLRDRGLLAAAKAQYEALASPCAAEGLAEVENRLRATAAALQRGQELERAADVAGAKAAYEEALAANPSSREALTALIRLQTAGPAAACRLPDALLQQNLLAPAKDGFTTLLKQDAACAVSGLAEVENRIAAARAAVTAARTAEAAGDPSGGLTAYRSALNADPLLVEALEGLHRLQAQAAVKAPFKRAQALARNGHTKEARAEVKKVISGRPGDSVPLDLRLWIWLLDNWLLTLTVVLLVVLLARTAVRRRSTRIEILDFKAASPTDTSAAATVTTLVQGNLHRLAEEDASARLDLVTGPDESADLPAVAGFPAPLTGVFGLLTRLLPRANRYVVTGALVSTEARGAGISLGLRRGDATAGQIYEATTLWAATGSKTPEAWFGLAPIAASWVAYSFKRAQEKRLVLAGTGSWESMGKFLAGAEASRSGNTDVARALFLEAIALDPFNRAALLGAGVADGRSQREEQAILRLRQVLRLLGDSMDTGAVPDEPRSLRAFHWDPMWYRASFNLVVFTINKHLRGADSERPAAGGPVPVTLREALGVAKQLHAATVTALACALWDFGSTRPPDAPVSGAELHAFISKAQPAIIVLLVGMQLEAGITPDRSLLPQRDAPMSTTTRYNLACFYARAREDEAALEHLALAIGDSRIAARARDDPSLKGLGERQEAKFSAIVDAFVEREKEVPPSRIRVAP